MKIVLAGLGELRVVWHHTKLDRPAKRKPRWTCAISACYLFDAEGKPLVGAHARCSYPDNFNRETGRKLSLARALHSLFPGEDGQATRAMVWKAYRERPRKVEVAKP